MIAIAELLKKVDEAMTLHQLARQVRCSQCSRKGAVDFRLHYVCGT